MQRDNEFLMQVSNKYAGVGTNELPRAVGHQIRWCMRQTISMVQGTKELMGQGSNRFYGLWVQKHLQGSVSSNLISHTVNKFDGTGGHRICWHRVPMNMGNVEVMGRGNER